MGLSEGSVTPPLEILRCPAWAQDDWLIHGFSTRRGGFTFAYSPDALEGDLNLGFTVEDESSRVERNRNRFVQALTHQPFRLRTLRQVHSNRVVTVGAAAPDESESADGMITDEPGFLLAIQTADCVPILLIDRKRRVVAAAHAGWRGTLQRIAQVTVDRMQSEFGCRPENISAAIGPCISGCCYEVGDEVREAFAPNFPDAEAFFTRSASSLHLDLVEANRRQLQAAGLDGGSVHALGECTGCSPDRFFSYRKSKGRTGRLMSVVGLSFKT